MWEDLLQLADDLVKACIIGIIALFAIGGFIGLGAFLRFLFTK